MFHLVPIPKEKRSEPLHLSLAFLGQFFVVAIVILMFVAYVAGLRAI
jgi:hypothetical protein